MKYQAHRGVGTEFPENTMPAFRAAAIQGYDVIELDPGFTKDGYLVVLHDETLNRTLRYPNGEKLKKETAIRETTYEEVLKYDAGLAKSPKFKGTKIPLLSEVLEFAKEAGLTVKIDNKMQKFDDRQTEILYDTVEKSGAEVAFTCSDIEYLKRVAARFPNAEIHYDGYVDEEKVREVKNSLINNPLTVWLCLKSHYTSWVTVPSADEELCAMVKKYGDLGLWLLYEGNQLELAKKFGADIIETTGTLKPKRYIGGIADCHSHTEFSHDSVLKPAASFDSAKEKGLFAFAITDHCDMEYCEIKDVKTPVLSSVKEAKKLGDFALAGVEIGEGLWYNDAANEIISSADYDIVLGSVHAVRCEDTAPFSAIDFLKYSTEQIDCYLKNYFKDVSEMIEVCDFDVLSHLTNPLKYISGKYGIKVNIEEYFDFTDGICRQIIEKGIALEVNTSCLGSDYDELMPEKRILERFKKMGGNLITLGSDGHSADGIARGFERAVALLKEIGFENLYYYKNRVPIQYALERFE